MKQHLSNARTSGSTAELEAQGWAQLEADNLEAALHSFQTLKKLDPGSEAAFQGQAAIFRRKRLDSRARAVIKEGLKQHPKSQGLLMERVWLAAERKQYPEALAALEDVLDINYQNPYLFLQKAFWLRETRRFQEAAETLNQVDLNFPGFPELDLQWGWLYFHQGLYDEAMQAFQHSIDSNPRSEVAWQGKIATLRKKGLYMLAEEGLSKALELFPSSNAIQNERAWLSFEEGFYPEAEAEFEIVLERRPDDPAAYVNQAWVYIRGEPSHLKKALDQCRKALQLQPLFPPAFSALGLIAFKQKRINEAESYLLQATGLEPIHGPYADLGALYIQLGRYADAEKVLHQAVSKQPHEAYVHIQLGSLFLHTERIKDAISEFRLAVSLAPLNPEPPRALSIALMEAGEINEAMRVVRQAVTRLPGGQGRRLHLTLAQLLLQIGDDTGEVHFYEEALKALTHPSLARTQSKEVIFYKGLAYYKIGDYRRALKNFRSCKEDEQYSLEAELNAQRLEFLIQQQKSLARTSRPERMGLGLVILMQLAALWYFYLNGKQISNEVFMVVVPLLLGLLVVAMLLPWLTKFKITGFEAELSEPEPRNSLATGPKGEVDFNNPSTEPLLKKRGLVICLFLFFW
jgi:tetratricopeptide (TPR) repeat protein